MSEFDDPQLERMLGRAGGALPDVNSAYVQVQGRVRHIKRRRAMVAGTAACFLLATGAVFAAGRSDDRANLQPAGTGDLVETTDPDTTLATDDSTSSESSQPGDTTPDGGTTLGTTANSGSTSGTGSGSSGPSTSSGGTATSATTPAGPLEQQFDSIGGSITVRLAVGVLTLVTSNPAGGFSIDSSTTTATRVEVRFSNGSHESRIRIDLVGGVMIPRPIEEKD
ncbi:MAG: hypothetical protein Q7V57_04205 [Actinomycetota bacterium]|nr:hypothetical protein [Actinomycetota bacterium]